VMSIGGSRVTLKSKCQRPDEGAGALADARPSPPANQAPPSEPPGASPSPPLAPETPSQAPAAAPEPPPQQRAQSEPEPAPVLAAPGGRDPNEVPVQLIPSGGGASILSFDWLDQKDDYVGSDGRRIAPGGGKDEHFRLVMDLPPASIVDEITITGGGVLRWTTKPISKYWPVAVVTNHELKIRGQSLRVGSFSGRWTFDLYVESHRDVRPGQAFGLEVVAVVHNVKHHLTARCLRK
jgi:hypothetical protein